MTDHELIAMINGRLERIENKVDAIAMNGCSKSAHHADVETRVRGLEGLANRAVGAAAAIGAGAGVAGGGIAAILAKLFQ